VTAERAARGRAEAVLLRRLADRGFRAAAAPVPFAAGALWYAPEPAGPQWTAQAFLPGRHPSATDARDAGFAGRMGRLLAALHLAASSPLPPAGGTRLAEGVRPLPAGTVVLPDVRVVLDRARAVVEPALEALDALPHCQIHGDVRLDNLLVDAGELAVIDLEFTRVDLRLLDVVSLVAGDRDRSGRLVPLPSRTVGSVLRAYVDTVAGTDLAWTEAESALFDTAAVAFLLLVLVDQLRAGSTQVAGVAAVLARLLERLPSAGG
jgi:Ser/Thr protein kinase RdoA (MazF antagonist)